MARPELVTFAAAQRGYNERQTTARTALAEKIKSMAELIEKLQNTPDGWTPEDQATLDELTTLSETATTGIEELAKIQPPTVPDVPPTDPEAARRG